MTHRNPNQRWLDNPEHKVSKAQLNRVKQAAIRSEQSAGSQPRDLVRDAQATNRLHNQ